jgi:hypothetical protein
MGTRLKGRIEQGAMPLLNRYFGTPILTQILNRLFGTHISDCNCGMRGLNRLAYEGLGVMSSGMEFASEMIVKAAIANVQIVEVPVTLRRDKRNRPPHLRPWTDGWRHLRLLLWHAPDATMSLPGALLFGLGLLLVGSQLAGPFALAGAYFDVHYMILGMTLALLGGSALCMGMVVHAVSPKERLRRFRWVGTIGRVMTFDRLIVVAAALGVAGLAADGGVLAHWVATHRGALSAGYTRLTLLGLLLLAMGFQFALSGLLLGSVQTAIARRLVARYSSPPPPPELSHPTLDIPRDGAFNPPL